MSRGGGGRGGRRNRGEGVGARGRGRGRQGGQDQGLVRFPSDHSNRHDSSRGDRAVPRYPSDSTRKDPDDYGMGGRDPVYGIGGRRTNNDGRGSGSNDGTRGRSGRSRNDLDRRPQQRSNASRGDRGQYRGGRPPRGKGDPAQEPMGVSRSKDGKIDPFELFCAYHLGITVSGSYRAAKIGEVATRFGVTTEAIEQALVEHNLHKDAIKAARYDMGLAKMDIQVSPPGVSKVELAKGLYEELLIASREAEARREQDSLSSDDEETDETEEDEADVEDGGALDDEVEDDPGIMPSQVEAAATEV